MTQNTNRTQRQPAQAFTPTQQLAYHAKVHAAENRRAGKIAEAEEFEAAVRLLEQVE